MLKIAAILLASAAGTLAAAANASESTTLKSTAPWWEKVTLTMTTDGDTQSCRYETSLASAPEACDVDSGDATKIKEASAKGEVTRITFERRFTPGAEPAKPNLATGDTLLGGQIMALAIDHKGEVKGCRVVAQSGSVKPEYGCDDASAERFEASLSQGAEQPRQGYMTIIVYGHSEHVV